MDGYIYDQISATDVILYAEHHLDNDLAIPTHLLHPQVTSIGAASSLPRNNIQREDPVDPRSRKKIGISHSSKAPKIQSSTFAQNFLIEDFVVYMLLVDNAPSISAIDS